MTLSAGHLEQRGKMWVYTTPLGREIQGPDREVVRRAGKWLEYSEANTFKDVFRNKENNDE